MCMWHVQMVSTCAAMSHVHVHVACAEMVSTCAATSPTPYARAMCMHMCMWPPPATLLVGVPWQAETTSHVHVHVHVASTCDTARGRAMAGRNDEARSCAASRAKLLRLAARCAAERSLRRRSSGS